MKEKFLLSMRALGLSGGEGIAVAVSGGGDSVALVLLVREWMREKGGRLLALTVNHGLRPGSAEEARHVHEILQSRGIEHRILTWEGGKPQSHIQERARAARYALLGAECKKESIDFLAVAHNAEDQAETFWMRLAHGSGLNGLAGMAAKRDLDGLTLVRPLLGFSRQELRDYCHGKGVEWIEDPANRNEKYLRVKLRQFEDMLAAEGLTPERLSSTLQKLEEARAALAMYAAQAFSVSVSLQEEGYLDLDMRRFQEHPAEVQRRVLEKALAAFSPGDYPPSFEALEGLRHELYAENFTGRTLGGCDIFPAGGKIIFCREEAAVEGRKRVQGDITWDKRFSLSGYAGVEVVALGEKGLSCLRKKGERHSLTDRLPFKVSKTLPALWEGENLVAVPHVSWYAAGRENLKYGRISAWPKQVKA